MLVLPSAPYFRAPDDAVPGAAIEPMPSASLQSADQAARTLRVPLNSLTPACATSRPSSTLLPGRLIDANHRAQREPPPRPPQSGPEAYINKRRWPMRRGGVRVQPRP